MRFLVSLVLLCAAAAHAGGLPFFCVLSDDGGAWPDILSSIGLVRQQAGLARVLVARAGAAASAEWRGRVESGAILVLEGESPLAEMFGFRKTDGDVRVGGLADVHSPGLPIVWEHSLALPVFGVPKESRVFARETRTGAPLTAGMRLGSGAVLWVAAAPGQRGYERFPYLLAALCDLGLEPPLRSARLWAFFDSAYRSRVDVDWFAAKWRRAGFAALHVAAWHFFEADAAGDAYLQRLIEACHREGILVYAWLELPHVSERFWAEHPEWREKTAVAQDAQLDWRKLMNLNNRACFQQVAGGVRAVVSRFDWDGVNLAELYFESLEGLGNPARFTPMNDDVRARFWALGGFDPLDLFGRRNDAASRRAFLDFRSELAEQMQEEWVGEVEQCRRTKPYLDLVLTHVDDRFDAGMRDAVGADARRVLPMLERHDMTLLVEDPATVWDLGPQRYATMAERYEALTPQKDRLAVDLNIVERYQNVYPTKQQTGIELFQLIHGAARSFQRVALYFENSVLPPDLPMVAAAAASVKGIKEDRGKLTIDAASDVGVSWKGPAVVDGAAWLATDGDTVWLPAGMHSIEGGPAVPAPHLVKLNGDLVGIHQLGARAMEFTYRSESRAIALLDRVPKSLEIDGRPAALVPTGRMGLLLPKGRHVVTLATE